MVSLLTIKQNFLLLYASQRPTRRSLHWTWKFSFMEIYCQTFSTMPICYYGDYTQHRFTYRFMFPIAMSLHPVCVCVLHNVEKGMTFHIKLINSRNKHMRLTCSCTASDFHKYMVKPTINRKSWFKDKDVRR